MKIEKFCSPKTPRPSVAVAPTAFEITQIRSDSEFDHPQHFRRDTPISSINEASIENSEEVNPHSERPIELNRTLSILSAEKRIRKCSRSEMAASEMYAT